MNYLKRLLLITASGLTLFSSVSNVYAEGSRYDLPRSYHSEISSAKAYLMMKRKKAVLIDVRRLREYAAGHPKKSYNVPFPHVVTSNDQDPGVLYNEIYNIVEGKTDTLIMTLCRTGFRSVLAANILADPTAYGIDGPAFTNVRNIWEGFVGRYKEADHAAGVLGGQYLDLNNNDVLDTDTADVYTHTKDANPDKDGWRNYQELPWSTKLRTSRIFLNDLSLYGAYVEGKIDNDDDHDDD
ncbi:MAG: rhodanese-like domain-containing protein [Gammaproteobacteria bacterium]|nr:rhodanese-like domain-containing protein [Gammaproteobacteria bacterium]